MRNAKQTRIVILAGVLTILGLALWPQHASLSNTPSAEAVNSFEVFDVVKPLPPQRGDFGDFFTVRVDVRRCVSPLCGGYFVRRVNQAWTRCANRRWARECYVAEIDWDGRQEVDPARALLRGDIVARRFARFGNLGALRVTQSWQSPTEASATGTFYRVRDRGVRCITHPCLSHQAAKLNSRPVQNIAGVDLAAAGATGEQISEAAALMTEPDGLIVAGHFAPVSGPGGRAQTLKASKFYVRAGTQIGGSPTGPKRCFKTGCSSEVCADWDVVTPCIFRPEFACYQKAMCKRQANGECGFTQTRELLDCLARARSQGLSRKTICGG